MGIRRLRTLVWITEEETLLEAKLMSVLFRIITRLYLRRKELLNWNVACKRVVESQGEIFKDNVMAGTVYERDPNSWVPCVVISAARRGSCHELEPRR
jgi:hypothetical protein